jgi:hypothetical protein
MGFALVGYYSAARKPRLKKKRARSPSTKIAVPIAPGNVGLVACASFLKLIDLAQKRLEEPTSVSAGALLQFSSMPLRVVAADRQKRRDCPFQPCRPSPAAPGTRSKAPDLRCRSVRTVRRLATCRRFDHGVAHDLGCSAPRDDLRSQSRVILNKAARAVIPRA